ncbi:MAG: sulfite reductase [Parachlamydiales bacterium]|nr:sulfite reductase [Parachlamydiales bacterium]
MKKKGSFETTLLSRKLLNPHTLGKPTYHLILDAKNLPSPFTPGDSLAILPQNDPETVQKTLQVLKATGDELVEDPRTKKTYSLIHYLLFHANITRCSSSIIRLLYERHPQPQKKQELEFLLIPENQEKLTALLHSHELWDLLLAYPEVSVTYQEVCPKLLPLLPRLYSICSAHQTCPSEIHLIVALVTYTTSGKPRKGVCSHFLCLGAKEKITPLPCYIHPSHKFSLPAPDKDIILLCNGTGIAPFRAFLEHRYTNKSSGKNWLFMGQRNKEHDFFYRDFFEKLEREDFLKLSLAFSRDQEKKIYIQNLMLQESATVWQWLEKGAYIYLCGSAQTMAKDVLMALEEIIRERGSLKEKEAYAYMQTLKKENRLLKDVY